MDTYLKRNIPALYVIKTSKWFNMVMPVIVLFYNDNGMGMHEIFILKSIYSVAIVAMEIPSGYFADLWGRKKTLLLGSVLGATGFFIYSFSYSFVAFILAEVILGLGHSFVSGADSAMLYDTLKANGKENSYVKKEGQITSAGNFAEALAGIAGGLLASITLRTPFFFQTLIAFSAIPASIMIVEPAIQANGHIHSVKKLFIFVRDSLLRNSELRVAILFSALTGTATLTFAWLVQPFLKQVNIPVAWFGVIWTMLNLTVGFASAFAYKIEKKVNIRQATLFILTSIAIGFIFSGMLIIKAGIAILFLFYIFRGIATPILKNRINQYTHSEVRATMLSVRNFVIRINFAVIGPALGYITDNLSLKSAFIIAGCIYLAGSAYVVFPLFTKPVSK